jgi:hypothetical protein
MTETQIQAEQIDALERLVETHEQRIAKLEKQLGRIKRQFYAVIDRDRDRRNRHLDVGSRDMEPVALSRRRRKRLR